MRITNYRFSWLIIGLMVIICTISCSSASGGNDSDAGIKYTVTFDYNYEGAFKATIMVEKGTTVEQPTDPSRNGYTFIGWYTEKEGINKFSFSTEIDQDITLFAIWDDSILLQQSSDPELYTLEGMTEILFGSISQNGYTAQKKYSLNGYSFSIVVNDTINDQYSEKAGIKERHIYFIMQYPYISPFTYNGTTYHANQSISFTIDGKSTYLQKTNLGDFRISPLEISDPLMSSYWNIYIDQNCLNDYELTKYMISQGYAAIMLTAYGKSSITIRDDGMYPAGKYLATN